MLFTCDVEEDSWIARRSNQSILKEISPGYSLEGLKLNLKLQLFCHQIQRTDSLENSLMLGKIEGGRRKGQKKVRLLDGITNTMVLTFCRLCKDDGQGSLECCIPWGHKELDMTE